MLTSSMNLFVPAIARLALQISQGTFAYPHATMLPLILPIRVATREAGLSKDRGSDAIGPGRRTHAPITG